MQVKAGPSDALAGNAKRLDCGALPGPVHRFTVSKSGRDSLGADGAMDRLGLSRAEMGTIVHPAFRRTSAAFNASGNCRAHDGLKRKTFSKSFIQP